MNQDGIRKKTQEEAIVMMRDADSQISLTLKDKVQACHEGYRAGTLTHREIHAAYKDILTTYVAEKGWVRGLTDIQILSGLFTSVTKARTDDKKSVFWGTSKFNYYIVIGNCGGLSDALFRLCDESGLTPSSVVQLRQLTLEKHKASPDLPLAECLDLVVETYTEISPTAKKMSWSKTVENDVRKRLGLSPARNRAEESSRKSTKKETKKAEPRKKSAAIKKASEISEREAWGAVRQVVVQLLNDRMRECDPTFSDSIRQEFMTELQSLFSVYQSKIQRTISRNRGIRMATDMTLEVVNDSLLTLNHDEVSHLGAAVDKLAIKKSFRQLVRKYHPDQNGGNEILRQNYEAVTRAHNVIEEYLSQYGGNAHVS